MDKFLIGISHLPQFVILRIFHQIYIHKQIDVEDRNRKMKILSKIYSGKMN